MKVILLKELRGRGGEGDVIDVTRGYAKNYLLTQGFAVEATPGNLKQLEQKRANIEKREEVRVSDAQAGAAKLNDADVTVLAQVGEEGQLFGSVGAPAIAEAIAAELGVEVDRRRIELRKPIKQAGVYPVVVDIYRNVKATVNVAVKSEAQAEAEAAAEAVAEEIVEEVAVEAVAEAVEE
jgi:large subunit ribosomal protein L9